jgi:hypothetical protein
VLLPVPGRLVFGPELFPCIGVFPGPATGFQIVNRGNPVAPLGQPQLNVPEKESHTCGRPLQPIFPQEPHHRRAADNLLTAKTPQVSNVFRLGIERVKGGEGKGLGLHLIAASQLRRVS